MRRSTSLRVRLFLASVVSYLVFLPVGPYPLYLGGIRVEYFLLVLVCAISVSFLGSVARYLTGGYGRVQISILLYLVAITASTVLSSDVGLSIRAFGTTLGYAYLTLVVPPLIYRHMNLVRPALLWVAAGTAVLVFYLTAVLGYGTQQRFSLADTAARTEADTNYVDPNMTAIGMTMCIAIVVPLLFGEAGKGRLRKRTIYRLLAVAVSGGVLFLESRTAAVSMVVAVAFGLLRAGIGVKALRRAILILAVLCVGAWLNRSEVTVMLNRLTNVESETADSGGRLTLFEGAWENWQSTEKTVVVGNGYFTSNPHNEYLRELSDDGLIGLTAFITMFFAVYMVCCRGPRYTADQILFQNILFGFIVSAMMSYGHTKTIWIALIFLLAGHLEAQMRAVTGQIAPIMAFPAPVTVTMLPRRF